MTAASAPPSDSSGVAGSEAATEQVAMEELRALETGALDLAKFPHSEHVRLGYEMLGRYGFCDAVSRFARGLKLLAAKAGKPQVYHETITVAFLALINERRAGGTTRGWREFQAANPDLFDKRCLEKWYGAEQLATKLAQQTFCLPGPIGEAADSRVFSSRKWTNQAQAIGWYAGIFSAYIIWSSFLTLQSHGHEAGIRLLALVEIAAAVFFGFRRTRLLGLGILLAVFAVATVADFAHGGVPFRFLFYAASALLVVWLVRPRSVSP
jgi:hypothetical protein